MPRWIALTRNLWRCLHLVNGVTLNRNDLPYARRSKVASTQLADPVPVL